MFHENTSMKKICPGSERTSIESKTNPKMPKKARQMKMRKEPEKPLPRKRLPHKCCSVPWPPTPKAAPASSRATDAPQRTVTSSAASSSGRPSWSWNRDERSKWQGWHTEMRPAVHGFSGVSVGYFCSCKVCQM